MTLVTRILFPGRILGGGRITAMISLCNLSTTSSSSFFSRHVFKVQRNSLLWQGYLFLTVTSRFFIYPGSLAWQWTKVPSQYLILLMKYDYIGSRFKQFPTKTDIEGKFLTLAEIFEGHWRQGSEKSIPPPSLPQQLYNFGGTNRKLLNSRKYK